MNRKRLPVVLVVFAATAVGLSLSIGTAAGQVKGKSTGQVKAKAAAIPVITVTMGKPTEFAFKLGKTAMIPVGKVTFKVNNAGAIGHNFRVCTKAFTAKALADTCVGTTSKTLAKGKTQLLTLTLKKGKFEFLCSLTGHAKNGMKGLLGVGVALSAADLKVVKLADPSKQPPPSEEEKAGSCASPVSTQITAQMGDYFFAGVPASIPCGNVSITAPNIGADDHNISFQGKPPGDVVHGGVTANQNNVFFGVGNYTYICEVGDHAANGMNGLLRVT